MDAPLKVDDLDKPPFPIAVIQRKKGLSLNTVHRKKKKNPLVNIFSV